jgi:ABC-2 type transport system ATP-binding protein
MKQKIGIIQALMTRAPLLILDEPTAGLDPLMVHAFRQALDSLTRQGGTTVFLSSHVLSEVETTCARIGLVRAGRMVATETIESLRQRSTRRVTLDFRIPVSATPISVPGAIPISQSDRQWVFDVSGPLGPLLQAVAALPVADLQIEPFKLEDYIASFYGVRVTA